MENRINRAEQLWQTWMEKQGQLEKLVGTGAESTRAVERAQYDFFRTGLYRIAGQPQEHEKLHLQAIALITRKLEKKLYPNPVIRFLHRVKAELYDKPTHLRQFQAQKDECLISLNRRFKELGLASYSGKLENFLNYESTHLNIPMTTQLSDKGTLDIDVQLIRDKTGQYQFNGYQAALTRNDEPVKRHVFTENTKVGVMEAANLLAGRAVKTAYEMADGTTAQKWLQLDLQTALASGSFKMLEFHHEYPLEKNLTELIAKAGLNGLKAKEVLKGLEQGHQVMVNVRNGQQETVVLQANPAGQSILVLDKAGKTVPMEALTTKKDQDNSKHVERSLTLMRTDRIEVHQDRSLGVG